MNIFSRFSCKSAMFGFIFRSFHLKLWWNYFEDHVSVLRTRKLKHSKIISECMRSFRLDVLNAGRIHLIFQPYCMVWHFCYVFKGLHRQVILKTAPSRSTVIIQSNTAAWLRRVAAEHMTLASSTNPITPSYQTDYSNHRPQLFYSEWATIAFFQLFEHYENRNTALHHHIMVDLVWEAAQRWTLR